MTMKNDSLRPASRTTLDDVARRAGVSAITVSRALRRPEMVSAKLREKVGQAVRELGYIPDPAARALASRRSNVIGVIIPSITNNVFSDVLSGIYQAVEGTDFDVQLGNTRYSPDKEEAVVRMFLSQRPAGLIVTGRDQNATTRALLETAGCPIVQIMEQTDDPIDMTSGFSHLDAARAATEHLLAQGYGAPGFIGARMDPRTQRRFAGFRAGAELAGLFSENRVVTTPAASSVSLGCDLLGRLLAQAPETDAVLCNNDDLALGVLFEAQRRGIAVPDRLGICGFNDLDMMAAAEPPITSVRTFLYRMGSDAAGMLIDRMSGRPANRQREDLGYEIMMRASTGRKDRG